MIDRSLNKEELSTFKKVLFQDLKIDIGPTRRVSYLEGCIQHPGQSEIHFTDWRYFVAMWGRRTGKTVAAAAEVAATMAMPRARIWIVAPTYELTDRVFEYVYKWLVVDKVFGDDSIVKASKTRELRYIETKWGSFVRGKSAESPNSLIGDQLDLLVLDEAARIPERVFTECLEPTTLDRQGRVLFISTPRGKNWFSQYFYRRLEPETREKGWAGSRFKTADNPYINKEWLDSKEKETPEDIWRREYEASDEHFSELIWPGFVDRHWREGGHLFNSDELPFGTVYRAIDVGWRHPTFAVWAKVDRENNVWVFREYNGSPNTIHLDHARNISTLSSGLNVYDTWISPDAKRKQPTVERVEDTKSIYDVYTDNGIDCRLAINDWQLGIDTVGTYLKSSLVKNAGHPGLYIQKELENLRLGIQNYVYKDSTNYGETNAPEAPRKYKDDAADALRYLLAPKPRFAPEWVDGDFMSVDRYGSPIKPVVLERRKSQAHPGAPIIAGYN